MGQRRGKWGKGGTWSRSMFIEIAIAEGLKSLPRCQNIGHWRIGCDTKNPGRMPRKLVLQLKSVVAARKEYCQIQLYLSSEVINNPVSYMSCTLIVMSSDPLSRSPPGAKARDLTGNEWPVVRGLKISLKVSRGYLPNQKPQAWITFKLRNDLPLFNVNNRYNSIMPASSNQFTVRTLHKTYKSEIAHQSMIWMRRLRRSLRMRRSWRNFLSFQHLREWYPKKKQ